MNLEQTIQRLRLWAARAQHEAQEADNRADMLHWQAQGQVLGGVANFLADQGQRLDSLQIWTRVVADREEAMAAWFSHKGGPEASFYSGAVAGYDVALTALTDVGGKVWPRVEPHIG